MSSSESKREESFGATWLKGGDTFGGLGLRVEERFGNLWFGEGKSFGAVLLRVEICGVICWSDSVLDESEATRDSASLSIETRDFTGATASSSGELISNQSDDSVPALRFTSLLGFSFLTAAPSDVITWSSTLSATIKCDVTAVVNGSATK